MATITKTQKDPRVSLGSTPWGNLTALRYLLQTSATGAVLGSDSSAPVAASDVIRVGPLPAGFRLVDSLVIVSDAAAGLNGKIGFAYQDGKDDAKVPQDDDYFGAAVALSAVARVRNATGNASVTLPKDAYLTVTASAAVAEAATVELIVFGIAEGVQ
mgnify:FL=1